MSENRKTQLVVFAVIILGSVVVIFQRWLFQSDFARGFKHFRETGLSFSMVPQDSKLNETEHSPKLVLFYTMWFGNKWPGIAEGSEVNISCGKQVCRFTHNPNELQVSDAVLFHGRDLPGVSHMKDIEKTKPPKQRWIFFLLESPVNAGRNPASLKGLFNWTMTYRIDSDIFLPYGYYTRLNPDDISLKPTNFAEGKDKLAVWLVSHCGTLRDEFVKKLLKYIKIDVFGSCAKKFDQHESCPRGSQECDHKLKRYKFYLSFENSFCVDYITEKYWFPLNHSIVPVVMGGASYENKQLAIPGSFINTANFESVEALAKYLLYLNANDTAYNEYFLWKKDFKPITLFYSWPCEVCTALNNDSLPAKVYDMVDFWGVAKNCHGNDEKIRKLIAGED